jgi:hypothetical protein
MKRKIICMFLCALLIGTIMSYNTLATKLEQQEKKYVINDNLPPSAPIVTAPEEVQRGKFFNIKVVTTDPEGDDVYYKFDIDGHDYGWVGPFQSGVEHTEKYFKLVVPAGSYIMGVQAKDVHCDESEWTYIEINVKIKNKVSVTINTLLFIKLLENHPHLFPLLQLLLRQ